MVAEQWLPKYVQVLILEPMNKYVTFHGKRDLAEMMKIRKFEMGRVSWISRWTQSNLWVLKTGKPVLNVVRERDT